MLLLTGLGNPGSRYSGNRHNIGFMAVDAIARAFRAPPWKRKFSGEITEIALGSDRAILLKPETYMNESGKAVAALMRRHGVRDAGRIVVVHDELDLPPGTVRVKSGGGLGGHNGLRSITERIGTQDFLRVRIGVGKPPSKERGADHVLSKVPVAEREILDVGVQVAADAVTELLENGPAAAMNRFNGS